MLNQSNKQEWLAGWARGAEHLAAWSPRVGRAYAEAQLRAYAHNSTGLTAWSLGYVAALASAVGGC